MEWICSNVWPPRQNSGSGPALFLTKFLCGFLRLYGNIPSIRSSLYAFVVACDRHRRYHMSYSPTSYNTIRRRHACTMSRIIASTSTSTRTQFCRLQTAPHGQQPQQQQQQQQLQCTHGVSHGRPGSIKTKLPIDTQQPGTLGLHRPRRTWLRVSHLSTYAWTTTPKQHI